MEGIQERNNQGVWNFIFALLYLAVFGLGLWWLTRVNGKLPTSINLFDFTLIVLATFRLTRLFVYDKITKFVRDWFLDGRELTTSAGDVLFLREKPLDGPRRTMADLLSCPWCAGAWFAPLVAFFYFLTPSAWFVILVLAIAGAASFIQVLSNMLGWRAEYLKREVNKE
ncbi:MAG: DUF1360 domain-containing protein [Candidatus Paceibacterota bacterium]|jgi:hypothetical protein